MTNKLPLRHASLEELVDLEMVQVAGNHSAESPCFPNLLLSVTSYLECSRTLIRVIIRFSLLISTFPTSAAGLASWCNVWISRPLSIAETKVDAMSA